MLNNSLKLSLNFPYQAMFQKRRSLWKENFSSESITCLWKALASLLKMSKKPQFNITAYSTFKGQLFLQFFFSRETTSLAMAFFVMGNFWIIKLDINTPKQPIGISKKPHTIFRLMTCTSNWCYTAISIMWSNLIPDKFTQRDIGCFGLLRRSLLTVRKYWSETIFTG